MTDMSEKFIDYLNGLLPADEEQKLFEALTYNDELRGQFRCFMAIDGAMKKSSMSFMPRASVTNAIFSSLGLPSNPGTAMTAAPKARFFASRLFTGLASGLTSAAASILIFWGLIQPVSNQDKTLMPHDNFSGISRSDKPLGQDNKPEINREAFPGKPIIKYIFIKETPLTDVSETGLVNRQATASIHPVSEPEKDHRVSNPGLLASAPRPLTEFAAVEPRLPSLPGNDIDSDAGNSGLSLEVRSSATWNLPAETISPSRWAKFNNNGLTLFYNLSDEFSVGADIRQETFFARYKGTESRNQLFKYDQQPNLVSLGLAARYSLAGIYGLKPMAQAYVGGNSYGGILRASLGLEYNLYHDLSVIGFFDYSVMYFTHQGENFLSKKLGFHYGINYKF